MNTTWRRQAGPHVPTLCLLLGFVALAGSASPSVETDSLQGKLEEQAVQKPQFSQDAQRRWPEVGRYEFRWDSGKRDSRQDLRVYFSIPARAHSETPILIVIPGAQRDADNYRDQWLHLSQANGFITLVLEGRRTEFPSEYEYNAGGVIDAEGDPQERSSWLFSAIEPLFDDFKTRYGSTRERYSLYGHSAGGGFVHRFLLFVPEARVDRAVAANPAFFTMPTAEASYPFGMADVPLPEEALDRWLRAPLTLLLGERDTGPRTKALSNGREARAQGPSVYARGLQFYKTALTAATERDSSLNWKLRVVPFVGHSNTHMASHAVPHLFGN